MHITAPARYGGLESVVRALSAGHRARGADVHVAAVVDSYDRDHPFLTALRGAGVPTHVLVIRGRQYRRERSEVEELCRALAPDVLHTHGYRSDVVDAGVARRLGIPLVTTVHGFTQGGVRGRMYEWAQVRSYRKFSAVVAVSERQVPEIRRAGVARERIYVVRNAWAGGTAVLDRATARCELNISETRTHIGWVGRLSPEKGPDLFIDAALRLLDLPVEFSIIGDGPARAGLVKKVMAAGAPDRFHWHGNVTDAGRLLAGFDLFVLSSRTEGTPIVLLEAMAAEVPIIATAVGGVPAVISGAEATLVPVDAGQLAQAMKRVLGAADDARRRARAAGERLRREFQLEPWLQAYENVYRAVTARADHGSLTYVD